MSTRDGGTQLCTADIALGTSGNPARVYAMHVISSGGGAAVISLRNGTSASATAYVTETGTTSKGVTFVYGTTGMYFPNGCFVDVDANTTSVAVAYVQ